jgi:ketosteroid isomerase-like protein
MAGEPANLTMVRRYLKAIEEGATGPELLGLFCDDIVQVEHPNRLKPSGDRRDRSAMGRDAVKGQSLLARQHYEITNTLCEGDRVAVEVRWEGVMAVPIGALPAGGTMVVQSAMFFSFRDGKIASQHNFDCVEAF